MKNIYELPTPPAVRVVSFGALRSIEASVELDEFTNQTLAQLGAPDALVQEIIPEASKTTRGQSCAVAKMILDRVEINYLSIFCIRH